MTARVSVVIPCHNYAHYLPGALDSVLGQTGVNVDVVVVDDASSDDSAARASAYRDERITVISRSSNGGPVVAFNEGLLHATGDYVVRLDADDLLTPGSLERATALLDLFPRCSFAYGRPWHFTGSPPSAPAPTRTSWKLWSGRQWLERRFRTGVNCITSPEVVMRHTAVKEVGGQRVELAQAHDMEMWLRLAAVGDVGYVAGPIQALHREHEASRSATQVDPLVDLRERIAAFSLLLSSEFAAPWMAAATVRLRYTLAAEALERVVRAYDRGRSEREPVNDYLNLARDLWTPIETHGRWRAVEQRMAAGRRAQWVPSFQLGAVRRRLREEASHVAWVNSGV